MVRKHPCRSCRQILSLHCHLSCMLASSIITKLLLLSCFRITTTKLTSLGHTNSSLFTKLSVKLLVTFLCPVEMRQNVYGSTSPKVYSWILISRFKINVSLRTIQLYVLSVHVLMHIFPKWLIVVCCFLL